MKKKQSKPPSKRLTKNDFSIVMNWYLNCICGAYIRKMFFFIFHKNRILNKQNFSGFKDAHEELIVVRSERNFC